MKPYLAPILLVLLVMTLLSPAQPVSVWFGTATPRKAETAYTSKGIYHATFDPRKGTLSEAHLAAEHSSPGFLALHPNGKLLYATGNMDGKPSVTAYRMDGTTLEKLNHREIGDGGAAHLSTDATGRVLITAQYGGGSVALFPLGEDGSIGERASLIDHEGGSGVVDRRQNSPHPHYVGLSPDNRFVFIPDLGLDQVVIYKLDLAAPGLHAHGTANVPPGGGPRHMKFSTDGKMAYVLNELAMSVSAFDYDAAAGRMRLVQTLSTLPGEVEESFLSASEIRIHPSGKFVYTANRGHDTIAVFAVEASGRLRFVETEPVRGSWPRNFNLDPSGKWLLAAGGDSDTVAVFKINQETGGLVYQRGSSKRVPSPICVLFGP